MDKYMQMAIEEAKKGIYSNHGGPFGCVIVLNDKKIYKDDEPDKVFTSLKEMQSIGLDFPFILKIKSELKNNGIEIPSNIKKIKDLGGYLCKLK